MGNWYDDLMQGEEDPLQKTVQFISDAENSKTDPKGGWNKDKQRWFPYGSLEGGEATLGSGTKLYGDRFSKHRIEQFYERGITEQEDYDLVRSRVAKDRQMLEKFVGRSLDKFTTPNQRTAISSYIYNVGFDESWKFAKNLKKAAESKNKKDRQQFLQHTLSEMDINTSNGEIVQGLINRRDAEHQLFNLNEESE